MTHTDQAFIQAYQRPVAQPAGTATRSDAASITTAETGHGATISPESIGTRRTSLVGSSPQFAGKTPLSEAIDRRMKAAARSVQPTTPDAATQISTFAWPSIARRLAERFANDFLNVAAYAATPAGALVLGVAGLNEGSGATTTALAIARSLATDNGPVAIIDANTANHHLADAVGVLKTHSLANVVATGRDASDAVVHAAADRVSLAVAGELVFLDETLAEGVRRAAVQLRRQHPIMIVDFGSVLDRQDAWDNGAASTAIRLLQPTGIVLVRQEGDISGGVNAARNVVQATSADVIGFIENQTASEGSEAA